MLQHAGILGLFLAVAAAYTIADVWKGRNELFDDRVTGADRQRLQRTALFVLLPLSVLLHEGGHAVMVKAFGGEITGFGFYIFYGYVAHVGNYTPLQLAIIAVAGTVVNVILGLGAAAIAWFRPRRAGVNYLLFVFAAFELLNALVFYPLLDAFGGVAGDFELIYSRATPVFSAIIGIVHITIVVGAVVLWRDPRIQAGYAKRVGRMRPPDPLTDDQRRELAQLLGGAAEAAIDGWKHPVKLAADAQAGATQMILRWESDGHARAIVIHGMMLDGAPRIEVHAAVQPGHPGTPPLQRPLARFTGEPTVAQLTEHLRRLLDYVDSWSAATQMSPG